LLEVNQLVAAFLAEKTPALATAYAVRREQKIKDFLFNGTKQTIQVHLVCEPAFLLDLVSVLMNPLVNVSWRYVRRR
jgi:hypothetical protein